MPTTEFQLLGAFETHSVGEIREILDAGLDVHAPIKGTSVVNSLTEMYSRSDAFPDSATDSIAIKRGIRSAG